MKTMSKSIMIALIVAIGVLAPIRISSPLFHNADRMVMQPSSFSTDSHLNNIVEMTINQTYAQINPNAVAREGFKKVLKSKWVKRLLVGGVLAGAAYTIPDKIEGGFVWIVEQLAFITSYIVGIIGSLVDYFLFYTISSTSYRIPFIEIGWGILRDLTNIVIIFSLLYLAFKMIVGRQYGGSGTKRQLVSTILVALVINFSLFITWVVVDAGNLLAHSIYSNIEAPSGLFTAPLGDGLDVGTSDGTVQTTSEAKSITTELIASLSMDSYTEGTENLNGTGVRALLYVFLLFIMIIAGRVLFSILLHLLSRTIGLFVVAIISPLAFASLALGEPNLPFIGFNNWLKQLFSLAFMAPIFVFFIYIIILFSYTPFSIPPSPGILNIMVHVAVPLMAIMFFLYYTEKVTKNLSGKLGDTIVSSVQKGIGGIVATGALVATGGTAAVGAAARLGGGALGAVGGLRQGLSGGQRGNKLVSVSEKFDNFGKKAMASKADVTKIPGFNRLVGNEFGKLLQSITGRSARDVERKAILGAINADQKLSGRDYYKDEARFEKDKRKAKKSARYWRDSLDLERAKNDDSMTLRINHPQTGVPTDFNRKEQKEQVALLKALLDQTKKQAAQKAKNPNVNYTQDDAKRDIAAAQAKYDDFYEETFDGRVEKMRKEMEGN